MPDNRQVAVPERFVGRERELGYLRTRLSRGRSVVVIGGRQSGKTWLVSRIKQEHVGRPVYAVSGDKLAFAKEEQALRKIAQTIGAAFERDFDAYEGREAIEARLRFIGACVLIIDETDRLLGYGWAGGFLAWLRSLIDTAGLGSTLAIVAVGGPILDHYRNPEDRGSPVLNLSDRLLLDPLDSADIEALLTDDGERPTGAQVIEAAGGQPALAQRYLREWQDTATPSHHVVMQAMLEGVRSQLPVWHEQLGPMGQRFLRGLPLDGVARAEVTHDEGFHRAKYLCLVRLVGDRVVPGPRQVVQLLLGPTRPRFEAAISYAGEDHRLGRAIHDGLERHGVTTFFAEAATDWLLGNDLYQVLPNLYGQDAGTVIIVCTATYLAKHWTRVEYDAVRAANGDRIVLLSIDGALPPDWPAGHLYQAATPANLIGFVDLVVARVRDQRV
jgi:hypothetical protein